MNSDQIGGLLRTVLAWGAGYAVSKGIVDSATAGNIASALVTLGVAGWSLWSNKPGTVIPAKPAGK